MDKEIATISAGIAFAGLALAEAFYKIHRSKNKGTSKEKKLEHLLEVRKRESDTLAQSLSYAHHQLEQSKADNSRLKSTVNTYAQKLNNISSERDHYRELYESEARKAHSSAGLSQAVNESTMLTNFFAFDHQPTPKEVKDRFKRLSSIYHPDKGGDIETMQEINTQYQRTIRRAS